MFRAGLIQCGDEVHEVNKVKVSGKTPTEVVQILVSIKLNIHRNYLKWHAAKEPK
jgi:C-terminal processing protease CtpA/Prc